MLLCQHAATLCSTCVLSKHFGCRAKNLIFLKFYTRRLKSRHHARARSGICWRRIIFRPHCHPGHVKCWRLLKDEQWQFNLEKIWPSLSFYFLICAGNCLPTGKLEVKDVKRKEKKGLNNQTSEPSRVTKAACGKKKRKDGLCMQIIRCFLGVM